MFKGATKPILGVTVDAGHFHGQDGLGDAPDPKAPGLDRLQKEGAVQAMIRIVSEHPGEVSRQSSKELLCAHLSSGDKGAKVWCNHRVYLTKVHHV